jgi:hypothetical protein
MIPFVKMDAREQGLSARRGRTHSRDAALLGTRERESRNKVTPAVRRSPAGVEDGLQAGNQAGVFIIRRAAALRAFRGDRVSNLFRFLFDVEKGKPSRAFHRTHGDGAGRTISVASRSDRRRP